MIQNWLSTSALLLTSITLLAQAPADWNNMEVFERNQVAPHATLMPYNTESQALEGRRKQSPNFLSLNGVWEFHWAENPAQAPADFYLEDAGRPDWASIRVPSNWQMEGFGYAKFRNIGLPHPYQPPVVPPDFNPVGSYFRSFELPPDWEGKEVFLHFEGVQSASRVWVNGREVGYNQGGMEPAEYHISPFLRDGQNNLAVRVLRFCDGSYLEDQDTWRLSGIYRDVYLMATPRQHLQDYYLRTDLDESYEKAELLLEARVQNYARGKSEELVLRTRLFDPEGSAVATASRQLPLGKLKGEESRVVKASMSLESPELWSAEYPRLYTLVMEVLDASGSSLEYLSQRVGIREVEVRDQAIHINGVPVKFNGVNSHMMHPERGHAMDVATMRQDLELMKRFNINCVRTSHYPPNVEYLDLANELGMYIVDECGDEAHAYLHLSSDPGWEPQYLDRMRKMVYRDRNQPSVVIWSAGNESGPGDNICALIAEGKRIDPSRPAWMYGGNGDEDPLTNPIQCEDIVGPRYLQPMALEQRFAMDRDDPRPSFMDEYIAATGNSLGGLDDYWELIYRYPRLTGGAIWDWISPGIAQEVRFTPDASPLQVQCALMNRAKLVEGKVGQGLYLSGQDDWLVTYRHPGLDISGEELSLSFYVKPEAFNGNGDYLSKGDYQFGIVQRDSSQLSFYLNTGERQLLQGRLPENWEGRWHHVAGIYDGKKMELYVDGRIIATRACHGRIRNSPYWVNLGKSAEMRDVHQGYMCHATLDQVRIFDRALDIRQLQDDRKEALLQHSKLWLDFELEEEHGSYWTTGIPGRTYGLVWPDRSIQPELWQLKKSPQPVHMELLQEAGEDQAPLIHITNRYHFRNLKELRCQWLILEDGLAIARGDLPLELPAGASRSIALPMPEISFQPRAEYHLELRFLTRKPESWAAAGHEVAWEQFLLQAPPGWSASSSSDTEAGSALNCTESEVDLRVEGEGFTLLFSKETGELSSLKSGSRELLERGPRLNVWRAPLANDLDSWNGWHTEMGHTLDWMGKETANGWRSLGLNQLQHELYAMDWKHEGEVVRVLVEANAHSNGRRTGFRVNYQYRISGDGSMEVEVDVRPWGNQPRWLPKLGLQMELKKEFSNIEWYGRGPFENYPDRKSGARLGRYSSTVAGEFLPYIIPQDYGNKCDVRWIELRNSVGEGLAVQGMEGPFHSSVQQHDTDHLDRAHYPFQLVEGEKVVLNLDHQVSGVGGTALSVLNPYRVFPENASFGFRFRWLPKSPD